MAIVCITVVGVAALARADDYDGLLKRYEQQIRQQERQLRSLKADLAEKESASDRWRRKAEEAKTFWSKTNALAKQVRRSVQTIREHRGRTRALADAAESAATEQRLKAQASDGQLAYWARELYAKRLLPAATRVTPEERWPEFLAASLCELSQTFHRLAFRAVLQETSLRLEEIHWQDQEQKQADRLDRLHRQQQTQWLRWQEAQRRRAALVEEIGQMEQSRQALHVLLRELREHRDHVLASRQGPSVESQSRALAALRGTLPWPAYGKVTQNFGRQYSEDLKQLLISNGIKIDAGANHPVHTVQSGKVLFAGPFRQYGQLVIVQHPRGLTSVYGGLGQTGVQEGSLLAALDAIGRTGDGGTFYFELRHFEQPINPLVYLGAHHHRSDLSLRRTFE